MKVALTGHPGVAPMEQDAAHHPGVAPMEQDAAHHPGAASVGPVPAGGPDEGGGGALGVSR